MVHAGGVGPGDLGRFSSGTPARISARILRDREAVIAIIMTLSGPVGPRIGRGAGVAGRRDRRRDPCSEALRRRIRALSTRASLPSPTRGDAVHFSRSMQFPGLAQPASHRCCLATVDRLDILINNAGIGTAGPRQTSAEGFELRFAVNYLAGFLFTLLLLPLIKNSAPARIVNVSSAGQQPT